MALALGDLDKEGESSLADSYLYRFGQFALDSRKRTRSRADSPVSLTPKTFDVLLFLAQNPNRLVSKEELLQAGVGRHLRGRGEPDAIHLPFAQGAG